MPNDRDKNTVAQRNSYQAVLLGLQRSTGAIVEYPLECIKSRWQVAGQSTSIRQVITDTRATYGMRGFYHGFLPSVARKVPVQMYRWPIILGLPTYFSKQLGSSPYFSLAQSSYWNVAAGNFLAGLSIACVETAVASPFETCRLELTVNRQYTRSLRSYFKHHASLKQQYIGVDALCLKECFGWTSFLVTCNLLRVIVKDYNNGEPMKLYQLLGISLSTAAANSATLTPWDVVRARIQKQSRMSPSKQVDTAFDTIKNIVRKEGAKALWRGTGIRFFQLFVATTLSVPVMEKGDANVERAVQRL